MVNLQADDLTIEVDERTPGRLGLGWLGRSNARNPGSILHPWFEQLFREAKERKMAIDMNFEKLEYFNSSTVAVLIQLISSARDRHITMSIRYDARLRWQALSFDALKRVLKTFDSNGGTPAVSIVSR
ncbi:MAG: hypothetical protein ABR567_05695 [Myxococcales bacterium]|nr:DUF1987 domain-containing protein [Myxococcales bacterium]